MQGPKLSIVLPTYKEKDNLAILVPQIEAEFTDVPIEIIIVDDNSRDGTHELARELRDTFQNVVLIERSGLLGIGSALRDGYNSARGEYILSSDADYSFRASDMRSLYVKATAGNDMVLGYKVYVSEEVRAQTLREWFKTYVFSEISNAIIGLFSGIGLTNYNTNFRILRSDIWKQIITVESRHFFLLETIIKVKKKGARITEIPVSFHVRKFGDSKVSFFKQAPGYFFKLVKHTLLRSSS